METKDYLFDFVFLTLTSMTLTLPEARAFPEDTPTPPTSSPQPIIDEHFMDTFMEQI